MTLPSAAWATCTTVVGPGPTAGTNTYSAGVDEVVCDDANAPISNTGGTANDPNVVFTLAGDNDELTVNQNPLFAAGGVLRTNGTYNTTLSGSGTAITVVTGGIGNDSLFINGGTFNGAIQGNSGNDTLVLTAGEIHGSVLGDGLAPTGVAGATTTGLSTGNDVVVIRNANIWGNVTLGSTGDQATNTSQQDRVFLYDGTVHGEFQNGPGTDYTFLFGGTILGTTEMQRGSINSVIVVDGARLEEGFEMQTANGSFQLAINPTFYMRSGFIGGGGGEGADEEIWGGANESTWIIDPVNSVDPNSVNPLTIGSTLADLQSVFQTGFAPNTNPQHLLILAPEENTAFPSGHIALGNANDILTFVGAVNNGSGQHNLQLGEEPDEDDIPTFDGDGQPDGAGTPGTADTMNVRARSDLLLGDVINFEFLNVSGGSVLTLTGESYSFSFNNTLLPGSGAVYVGGNSTLWLQAPEMVFNTAHLELGGPTGGSELQPASYYDAFDPGSILRIGAEAEDEDDDEGGGDEEEESFLADVTINTGPSTFNTAGTIDMVNGLAGDRLTINGPYEAHDANLALDSFVKDKSSPTDRLTLTGPVSGTTTIYVNNVNSGQGAYTGKGDGDGIQLVAAQGLSDDSFRLGVNNISGQREVTSGAFSYQLAIDDSGAYLQSDILDQVPGYVMAGAVADRHVYAGLETLYQRMGELRTGPIAVPNLKDGGEADWKVDSVWARGNFANYDVDAAKGWDFDSDTNGFLIGVDPSRPVGEEGVIHLGVFAGYNSTDATVDGFTWGRRTPTKVDIEGWTVGGYATFFNRLNPGQGFYADLVGKVDGLDLDINNGYRRTHDSTDAGAYTGSAEIGYGFKFGGGWALQPSGEITFISVDQGNYASKAYGFNIHPEDADSAVGRLGIQLQDTMYSASGTAITPYVNFNVLSEFDGSSTTVVGGTPFESDLDGTWYDVGAGLTAAWSTKLALYGNIDYKFGDVEGLGGTVGARVHW